MPWYLADQLQVIGNIGPAAVTSHSRGAVPRRVVSIVLTRDTLNRSGADIAREATSWLLRLAGPVTDQQVAQARRLAADTQQRISVETGPPEIASGTIQTVMLVATGVLSLLIVTVGLALMTAETRQDDTVLSSVGASPSTRRSVAAARAGALTLLGAILAVPAGLVPIWGLSTSTIVGPAAVQLTIPFMTIAADVLLVPGIAGCRRLPAHKTRTRNPQGTAPQREPLVATDQTDPQGWVMRRRARRQRFGRA
jgi:hypothetical protein